MMAAATSTRRKPLNVLLVEDDSIDAKSVRRAFRHRLEIASITHVTNGVDALNRLRGDDGLPPMSMPYLVLLDLKMPGMDGHEFLSNLRGDPELRGSVVFVLTTSGDTNDVHRAYDQFAAGYFIKKRVGRDFDIVTRLVETYWQAVELPAGDH